VIYNGKTIFHRRYLKTHLNHSNIIGYCNRPFKDVDHMNNSLVKNWNERVKPDDTIIVDGDFCFKNTPGGKVGEGGLEAAKYWIAQLNGEKIFVRGNHDKHNSLKTAITGMEIVFGGYKMWVVHNPNHYNPDYEINIVGHVHDFWKIQYAPITNIYKPRTILVNVGVDVWDFKPVPANKIIDLIFKFKRENI